MQWSCLLSLLLPNYMWFFPLIQDLPLYKERLEVTFYAGVYHFLSLCHAHSVWTINKKAVSSRSRSVAGSEQHSQYHLLNYIFLTFSPPFMDLVLLFCSYSSSFSWLWARPFVALLWEALYISLSLTPPVLQAATAAVQTGSLLC